MDGQLRQQQRAAINGDDYDSNALHESRIRAGECARYPIIVSAEVIESRVWLLSQMVTGALEVMPADVGSLGVTLDNIMRQPFLSPLDFVPMLDPRGETRAWYRMQSRQALRRAYALSMVRPEFVGLVNITTL